MTFQRMLINSSILAMPLLIQAQDQAISGSSRQPLIYAQKLVNDTLAKHKELVVLALHVTPPNQTENVIIASNIGRIGKKADEDDLRVINTGDSNLEVNKTGDRIEDEVPLLDRAGNRIGAAGIVFNYKTGDDKKRFAKMAEHVRDEMRSQIPSKEKLFEEVKD